MQNLKMFFIEANMARFLGKYAVSQVPRFSPFEATAEEISHRPFSLPVASDPWKHDPDRTTRRESHSTKETTRVTLEDWWDQYGPWTTTADINPYSPRDYYANL